VLATVDGSVALSRNDRGQTMEDLMLASSSAPATERTADGPAKIAKIR
jgi:hypothetical protein